jgi:hypothetical protein
LAEGVIRRSGYNVNAACAILRLMSNYRRAFVPGECWFFSRGLMSKTV